MQETKRRPDSRRAAELGAPAAVSLRANAVCSVRDWFSPPGAALRRRSSDSGGRTRAPSEAGRVRRGRAPRGTRLELNGRRDGPHRRGWRVLVEGSDGGARLIAVDHAGKRGVAWRRRSRRDRPPVEIKWPNDIVAVMRRGLQGAARAERDPGGGHVGARRRAPRNPRRRDQPGTRGISPELADRAGSIGGRSRSIPARCWLACSRP